MLTAALEPAVAVGLAEAEAEALPPGVCARAMEANTIAITAASILARVTAAANGTETFLLDNTSTHLLLLGDNSQSTP
jgi:hypothetical protein